MEQTSLVDVRRTHRALLFVLFVFVAGLGACVIPLPKVIVFPGQQYRGECDCEVCLERDAMDVCVQSVAEDFDVHACSKPPDSLDDDLRAEIRADLAAACSTEEFELRELLGDANAMCSLDIVRPDATGDEAYFEAVASEEGTCPEIEEPFSVALPTPGVDSQTAVFNSIVVVTNPDFSATIDIAGIVEFSGANCRIGSCPVALHRLALTSDEFEVHSDEGTTTVTDAVISNTTEGVGTCTSLAPLFPDACGFVFETGTLQIVLTGVDEDGKHRILEASNDQPGGGVVNFATKEVAVTQTFESGDTIIEFGLHGTVANFSPRVVLPAASSVECGGGIEIGAEIEDVDGDPSLAQISWYVDGEFAAVGVNPFIADFAPGEHTVSALVLDEAGGIGTASTTLEVAEDVAAPTFVSDPPSICLWPPNHQSAVLTSNDVGAVAVDNCDPAPEVFFLSGESSQPEDAIGDGSTLNDVVVKRDSICLRQERQGTVRDGRQYLVQMVAVDAAGNTSDPVLAVVAVPHDQSPNDRCDVSGGTPAADDDPRCVPSTPSDPGGCGVAGTGSHETGLLLFSILGFWLAVRRRR